MTKKKIRYCDRCKKEMPKLLDFTEDIIPFDLITKGYKTSNGRTSLETKDICQECYAEFESWLAGNELLQTE